MSYITVGKENSSNIDIYFKEWGIGQPIVFSQGWPLNADAWEDHMLFLSAHGYRCIAPDHISAVPPIMLKTTGTLADYPWKFLIICVPKRCQDMVSYPHILQ